MSLIVEDGSNVSGANSYVSVADIRTFAEQRGVTLPAADSDVEILAIKAMDFIEYSNFKYLGHRVFEDQELGFPRTPIYIDGVLQPYIPKNLTVAQCQLSIDVSTEADLKPNGSGRETVKEKVGAIEVEYNPQGSNTVSPVLNKALDLLKPLTSLTRGLTVTRI